MLTYVYACTNKACWKHDQPVEVQHSIADCDKPHVCGECGGAMQRLIRGTPQVLWPGRAIGERDGWWEGGFPKMESVRDGEHKYTGVDLPAK